MRGAREGEGASHAGKDTPRFFEKQHAGRFFRAEGGLRPAALRQGAAGRGTGGARW